MGINIASSGQGPLAPNGAAQKKKQDEAAVAAYQGQQNDLAKQWQNVQSGGYGITPDIIRQLGSYNVGASVGQKEFIDNPEMQRLKGIREEYAKGYSGEETGNIRQTARGEIAGSQQAAQRQLASKMARGGVGGARGAAMAGAQAQQGAKTVADAERKMALDSANMKRQGAADLQDFIFRQKMGKMGTAAGFMSTGSADFAAQQSQAANRGGGKK